ncbi:hypothetical protein [Dyadobacter diqingensis]|uniref:hypothetical protein n=1 Tax=Dyadobacter diqingensis TaxID=2938121 RepID=UPI0020C4DA1F|nr:hypothetical protein [Dyadobacter diqingensis]
MKDELKNATKNEDEQELIKCLDFIHSGQLDSKCYDYIQIALTRTWHSQHEDLLNTIYLEKLSDDRFVQPILNIALDRERFRWYDDELEATLRKCVHVLKTINSENSNRALEQLEQLNNDNIKITLEMYK